MVKFLAWWDKMLKKGDLFTKQITFTFKGKDSMNSTLGGVVSLWIILAIFV